MSNHRLVPVEPIRRAIDALERFANDTLAGRISARELRELLAAEPAVQAVPTRQYFYRTNDCLAKSAEDDQCICWHNEGEGPLADGTATHWRDVTQPTPIMQGELVGEAGALSGANGFTVAVFESTKVPEGTKLYIASH